MKITVIGASKGTGLATTIRALEREHEVFTLSRSKVPLPDYPKLHKYEGNALDKEKLKAIIHKTDAVIVALGQGKNLSATTLMTDFGKLLLEINKEEKIEIPVIFLSGFGAGDSLEYNKPIPKMVFKTLFKKVYADKNKMEQMIAHSDLNWIIVRPGKLTDTDLTEMYRVEDRLFDGIDIKKISRADVADFMVKQGENPSFIGKFVSMTS